MRASCFGLLPILIEIAFGGATSVEAVVPVDVVLVDVVLVDVVLESVVDVDLPPPCDVEAVVVVFAEPDPAVADLPDPGNVVGLPDPVAVPVPCEVGPLLVGACVVTCGAGAFAAPAPLPCADMVAVIAAMAATVRNGFLFIVEVLPGSGKSKIGAGL